MNARLLALVEAARKARERAYCPYSRYPVGAAVLAGSGRIFDGANVEIACLGLGVCAERAAVYNAASRGERRILAAAVAIAQRAAPRPCGACRQVLAEFAPGSAPILLARLGPSGRLASVSRVTLASLLPSPFRLDRSRAG